MTAFDKYRKAAGKRDLSAALAEFEALLVRERDLLYHQVFTSQITEDEANRRLLYLLKIFFIGVDVNAFFQGSPSPQMVEQMERLAIGLAEARHSTASKQVKEATFLHHLKAFFIGLPTATPPAPQSITTPTQQTLFT